MAMRMARGCWWYYFSKFTEFTDTIFFVLRKKNNQVSTLHVIHHGCMPMSVWFGVKFTPGTRVVRGCCEYISKCIRIIFFFYLFIRLSFFFFLSRRSQHLLRPLEHVRTHSHVLLLSPRCSRTKDSTVPMVEKIFDEPANDSVRSRHNSRLPIALHRLRLPERFRMVYRHARDHVLLLVS